MDKLTPNQLSIIEQAHDWYSTLRTAGPAEHAAFVEWLKASPRHAGEFLMVTAVYQDHTAEGFGAHIDVQALLANEDSNVVPLQIGINSVRSATQSTGWKRTAMAAGVIVAIIVSGWVLTAHDRNSYQTARGEFKTIALQDGSTIHLNTASKIKISFTADAREIHLLTGEALFTAARDPSRPFRVHSGDAVIQAVGTQFNVYRHSNATTVSVLEGRVAVGKDNALPRLLEAGEEVRVAPQGALSPSAPVDVKKVTAWQQHLLVFRGDTLAAVAAEFNRYNDSPRFKVDDPIAADKQFTGIFDAKSPESFVRILEVAGDLDLERNGDRVIVRHRAR